jgi:hypothetical protein
LQKKKNTGLKLETCVRYLLRIKNRRMLEVMPTLGELEKAFDTMMRYNMSEAWLERLEDGKLYTFQSRPSGTEAIHVTDSSLEDWIVHLKRENKVCS